VRYEKGHRTATRERIVDVASRRFRAEGVAAVGLTGIMADAGLTNGAFYTHFSSKDELVKATLVHAMNEREAALKALGATGGDVGAAIREYLSVAHRDDAASGCPSASLLGEIRRQPVETRDAYTAQITAFVDLIAAALPGNAVEARQKALAIFGLMAGTLQLARAVSDPVLSQEVLEAGAKTAIALAQG